MLFGLGLASLLSTGCLVAEAPEYGPPRKTTPVINLQRLVPTPFAILKLDSATASTGFSVPIKSEDAGEQLVAALFVDSEVEADRDWAFPPATRNLTFRWEPRGISPGCHLLKLIVTHADNYNSSTDRHISEDVATVTWWMNFDAEDPLILENCPVPGDTPDAGS
jgi:hypothetical protein